MKANWNYPTTVWIGEDRIKDLFTACKDLQINNPLFVTDKDLIQLQMVKKILDDLQNDFKNIVCFSNFSGNP